jgi:hypothetical protein
VLHSMDTVQCIMCRVKHLCSGTVTYRYYIVTMAGYEEGNFFFKFIYLSTVLVPVIGIGI